MKQLIVFALLSIFAFGSEKIVTEFKVGSKICFAHGIKNEHEISYLYAYCEDKDAINLYSQFHVLPNLSLGEKIGEVSCAPGTVFSPVHECVIRR